MTAMLRDLLLGLAETVPAEWFLSHLSFFAETYAAEAVERITGNSMLNSRAQAPRGMT